MSDDCGTTCGCGCDPIEVTAQQLKDKYEADLKSLQENCPHPKVSDWLPYYWAPAHYSHDVKQCEICWTVVEKRGYGEDYGVGGQ